MEEKATPQEPYGQVSYADPGYQADGKKRYPVDTPAHVRAAKAYIAHPANAAKYQPKHLKLIKARINRAAKKHGIGTTASKEALDSLSLYDNILEVWENLVNCTK
jgi:hypothetical protein